jgi:predicted CXXCH cytochrome family protein
MNAWRDRRLVAAAALIAAAGAARSPLEAEAPPPAASYVGAARCGSCHAAMHARWKAGRHSRMLQPATALSVRGDFDVGTVTLRGQRYGLRAEGGEWFVRESYLTGAAQERRVDFTLGSRRIQHYLTRLADGRIVVLPPSWDVQRREWFHNLDIVDLEESGGTKVQVWNASCHGCHVSGQQRNYRPESRTYDTSWTDFGTACERCHGPGSRHAQPDAGARYIVRAGPLGAEKSTAVCAQCHSLRDVVADGYVAGADYHDHFMPILEYAQKPGPDPAYWPDGRPRRFSNDAIGLWQSRCYLKGGATCAACHDPHEPDVDRSARLAPANAALCLGCHPEVARDVPAHTRHAATSAGSACVECHMPRTVVSIKAAIRDHAISVPVPEASVRFGIPNACNACHADRSAAWARDALRAWKADGSGARMLRRAEAFTGGRQREAAALPLLAALAVDPEEPPLVRANAVGHLRGYGAAATETLVRALGDASPVVRAVAALTLSEARAGAAPPPALAAAVRDERTIVRIAAAFALMSRGMRALPGEDAPRYEAAKAEYVRRAALLPDEPSTQLTLGQFLFLDRDYTRAAEAFEAALRLRDRQPGARYFLALARLGQGRAREARQQLEKVPPDDPHAAAARGLLRKLPEG